MESMFISDQHLSNLQQGKQLDEEINVGFLLAFEKIVLGHGSLNVNDMARYLECPGHEDFTLTSQLSPIPGNSAYYPRTSTPKLHEQQLSGNCKTKSTQTLITGDFEILVHSTNIYTCDLVEADE